MDTWTKAACVALVVIAAAAVWWYLRDQLRHRRRARAENWAQQQMSPDEPPARQQTDDPTVPLDLCPAAEPEDEDVPALVRPYMWMCEQTVVLPAVTDDPHAPGRPKGVRIC